MLYVCIDNNIALEGIIRLRFQLFVENDVIEPHPKTITR